MSERTNPAEHMPTVELPPYHALSGAQLRLVLPPIFINPDSQLVSADQVRQLAQNTPPTYDHITAASTHNRIEETQNVTKEAWLQKTKRTFQADKHKQTMQQLSPFLRQFGINEQNITITGIQQFYDRFFENPQGTIYKAADGSSYHASDFEGFVKKIVDTHTQNGSVNETELQQKLPAYRWLARIFGSQLQDAVVQMIDIEAKTRLGKKEEIVTAGLQHEPNSKPRADKTNLLPVEDRMLRYIWKHGVLSHQNQVQPVFQVGQKQPVPPHIAALQNRASQQKNSQPPTQQAEPAHSPELSSPVDTEIKKINEKYVGILEKDINERTKDLPLNNAEAALVFTKSLRNRIAQGTVVQQRADGRTEYQDPQSEIKLSSIDQEGVKTAWFAYHEFTNWANRHNLPLVFFDKGGHAALLLKPPYQDEYNQWHVDVYDPQEGNQPLKLEVPVDYGLYRARRMREFASYRKAANGSYILPDNAQVPPGSVEHLIKNEWWQSLLWIDTHNNKKPVRFQMSDLGRTQLHDGTYSMHLQDLPDDILESKLVKTQADGWNCIPLSFFAGVIRHAAQPGDTEFKRSGIQAFQNDFGIRILTREEILQSS